MRKTLRKYAVLLFTAVAVFFSETLQAQYTIPEKPAVEEAVYDYIDLLSEAQLNTLKTKLKQYADTTSTQIVIAIISTTKGEDISMLGAKWGQQWGVGQAEDDNGIFIILAKDDRTIDINTGYGIEYRITDRMAERIINSIMIPEFKTGDYYAGLSKGTDAIFDALNGEFKEDRDFSKGNNKGHYVLIFIVFLIIMILLGRNKGGKGKGGTGSLLDVIILSSMGRTGGFGGGFGSGSGSSGGGFGGGFGGGGFGGGGASGSW